MITYRCDLAAFCVPTSQTGSAPLPVGQRSPYRLVNSLSPARRGKPSSCAEMIVVVATGTHVGGISRLMLAAFRIHYAVSRCFCLLIGSPVSTRGFSRFFNPSTTPYWGWPEQSLTRHVDPIACRSIDTASRLYDLSQTIQEDKSEPFAGRIYGAA